MSDLDDRIRGALSGLAQAPIPKAPSIRPWTPERRTTPPALLAAAAMLPLLAGSLFFMPARGRSPEATALAAHINALEARIARLEDGELRSLMGRELALLRRELELSEGKN
jgi:hypothetical protein